MLHLLMSYHFFSGFVDLLLNLKEQLLGKDEASMHEWGSKNPEGLFYQRKQDVFQFSWNTDVCYVSCFYQSSLRSYIACLARNS